MKNPIAFCLFLAAAACETAASSGSFRDAVSGATFRHASGIPAGQNIRFSPNGSQVSIGTGGEKADATTRATFNAQGSPGGTQAIYGSRASGSLPLAGSFFGFTLDGRTLKLAPFDGVNDAATVDFTAAPAGTFTK